MLKEEIEDFVTNVGHCLLAHDKLLKHCPQDPDVW